MVTNFFLAIFSKDYGRILLDQCVEDVLLPLYEGSVSTPIVIFAPKLIFKDDSASHLDIQGLVRNTEGCLQHELNHGL
jgi:hypothetical protein